MNTVCAFSLIFSMTNCFDNRIYYWSDYVWVWLLFLTLKVFLILFQRSSIHNRHHGNLCSVTSKNLHLFTQTSDKGKIPETIYKCKGVITKFSVFSSITSLPHPQCWQPRFRSLLPCSRPRLWSEASSRKSLLRITR